MDESGRPLRHAGRVIVLDPGNRVLLFRYDSLHHGLHWGTPGGGLEHGEDYHAAAVRELREETGWDDVPVATVPVFTRTEPTGAASRFAATVHRFFPARVAEPRRPVADVDGMHASDGIVGYHWWTLAEVEAATEPIRPDCLADLLRRLTP